MHACAHLQPPWAHDTILQPLLRRTPSLHTFSSSASLIGGSNKGGDAGPQSWGAVLLLDSVATSQVRPGSPS